jgi:hypothetical protein
MICKQSKTMKNYLTHKNLILIAMAMTAGLMALLIPAIQAERDAALELSCAGNLKHTSQGLLNLESSMRKLPKAIQTSSSGKPYRSWRTQVYPDFLEQLPRIYDASTAWDSGKNMRLINGTPISIGGKDGAKAIVTLPRVPFCFACPKCKNPTGVNYVVVTGTGTLFPEAGSVTLSDVSDGVENTLLLVESVTCTPEWIEPRDLDIRTMQFAVNSRNGPSISSFHPGGALVCFADLEVFLMTESITALELQALITIDGGEPIRREELVSRAVLIKKSVD